MINLNTLKIMKNSYPNTDYDEVIKLLTKTMTLFNTDHLRLCIDVKGMEQCKDKRDYARVLRSAASRGLCRKTDVYQKSNLRGSNNIPRAMWCHVNEEVHP